MATNNTTNSTFDNISIVTNTFSSTNTNGNIIMQPNGSGNIKFNNNSVDTLVTNSTGHTIMAKQPSFLARLNTSTGSVTGDGTVYTVKFDTVSFDQTTSYASGTGLFTAPVAGNYRFYGQISTGGTSWTIHCQLVTTARTIEGGNINTTTRGQNNFAMVAVSAIVPMALNDTAAITIIGSGSTKNQGVVGNAGFYTFFCGELVC